MSVFQVSKQDLKDDYQTRLRKVLGYNTMASKIAPLVKTTPFYSEDGLLRIGSSNVTSSDILLRQSIQLEIEALVEEHRNFKYLKEYNLPITNKILFYGPSGCGKTLLASVVANILKKPIFIINLSRVVSSGLGQTSVNLSEAMDNAARAGAVLLFDEFDALTKERGSGNDHGEMKRVTSSLLQMIDNLNDSTILIAATNHIDLIDSAILRRFSKKIEFFEPNNMELKKYITMLAEKAGLNIDTSVKDKLSEKWKGSSFATTRDKFVDALKKFLLSNKTKKIKVIDKEILKYT